MTQLQADNQTGDHMAAPDARTQAMVREAAKLMGALFINRPDRKAVFRPDHLGQWHWTALDERFKLGDFTEHLTGTQCLGTYLLGTDSTVKFFAFDIDVKKEGKFMHIFDLPPEALSADDTLKAYVDGMNLDVDKGPLEAALHDPGNPAHRWVRIGVVSWVRGLMLAVKNHLDLDSLPVITGGGAHVLVPLPEPLPATEVRSAAIECLLSLEGATRKNDIFYEVGPFNEMTIEVFPKQDSLDGKSYGNLIRLPFGWHNEAQIRTYTFDPEAPGVLWDLPKVSSIKALRRLAGPRVAA